MARPVRFPCDFESSLVERFRLLKLALTKTKTKTKTTRDGSPTATSREKRKASDSTAEDSNETTQQNTIGLDSDSQTEGLNKIRTGQRESRGQYLEGKTGESDKIRTAKRKNPTRFGHRNRRIGQDSENTTAESDDIRNTTEESDNIRRTKNPTTQACPNNKHNGIPNIACQSRVGGTIGQGSSIEQHNSSMIGQHETAKSDNTTEESKNARAASDNKQQQSVPGRK